MSEHEQHTIAEAADADLVEQRLAVDDGEAVPEEPVEVPIDAPEGDVLEQSLMVSSDDDDLPRET